jgi:hypothetical protein
MVAWAHATVGTMSRDRHIVAVTYMRRILFVQSIAISSPPRRGLHSSANVAEKNGAYVVVAKSTTIVAAD